MIVGGLLRVVCYGVRYGIQILTLTVSGDRHGLGRYQVDM